MHPTTIFITRYVTDHRAGVAFYAALFGHPIGVSYAFGVADLATEQARLAAAGLVTGRASAVEGFESLVYAEITDPEGAPTGLLTRRVRARPAPRSASNARR